MTELYVEKHSIRKTLVDAVKDALKYKSTKPVVDISTTLALSEFQRPNPHIPCPEPTPGIWVVTGANRGLGLALISLLRSKGHTVYGCCRESSPELVATGAHVISGIDATSDTCGQDISDKLVDVPKIDVLVNNAGMVDEKLPTLGVFQLKNQSIVDTAMSNMRLLHEINVYGPFKITQALLHKLTNGSKVVMISTLVSSIALNKNGVTPVDGGQMNAYRCSKASLNMLTRSISQELHSQGISAVAISPGVVGSEMFLGRSGAEGTVPMDYLPDFLKPIVISPEQSAEGVFKCCNACCIGFTGEFIEGREDGIVVFPW